MEAVPRMPMLSFELKQSPEFVEFGPTLKQYIRDHYGEDPAHYNKSCNELEQLRQSAVHVSHDFMGCSILKKYNAQLQFLQGRFPMTEMGEAAMPFTWEDVYSGREVTHNDIKFEQACILYNIGSLHSLLGAMDTRQSADGMKVSCTHFQCAAWAYEYLRDHYGSSAMSLDMSHELLTFQSNLMLAQAQECILEKSMADSRKSSITAKVSAQIAEFYSTALKSLTVCNTEELISSKQFKDWKKKIDIKVLFYTCITNFYMGQQSQEQQKWGQCLAYYTLALNKLEECEKLAKNESSDVQESLRFTHDVVGGKHQAAKKDNDFVYHEKVPDKETLPDVKGAPLVKGIPFNANDPEISGPDIFIKLVPMSAHEASSLYSEEKATLLRRMASEIAEKDDELNQYLSSLQLDQTELNPEPERLPQQLLEKCAAISVRPNAIKDLVDSMTSVSNVATEVDLGIQEIQQMLQEESKAELEYQELFGKRAPNIILSEIAKECAKFEEGHKKGSQSNTDLHKAMNTHINNLKLLSSPLEDIQKLLPSVDKERGPESADIIKELNMLMGKVEEMRTQRQTLEQTMRKEIMEDDITGTLAKQEGVNRETVFAEQLKKHEKTSTLIRQNLTAQANILRALTDANAKYANVRRTTRDTIVRRDQMIRELINSYDIYEDLMAKSQKGLEFYKKLEANVQKLLSRCRGVCKVQQEEREQMMNRFKPKAQAPSRPTTDKPVVPSPVGQNTGLPPLSSASVTPMFDGPKLKDYLPFMKPNTFGKKAGSPDLSKADPAVQNYISKTGSLPNSGTASPVHIPNMSGSVPASPDHMRQSKFTPQPQDLHEGYPSLQDTQGPTQGQMRQQYPVLPGGQGHPEGHGLPPQGQTSANQRMNTPSPRGLSQSPSSRQQIGYVGPPQGPNMASAPFSQSQLMNQAQNINDQYVPLNEKWKREAQGRIKMSGMPSTSQGHTPNLQGQQMDPRLGQGYVDPKLQTAMGTQSPMQPSQSPVAGVIRGQPHQNPDQFHQIAGNPNLANMQYKMPDQQQMLYGQQPMVGYREVTNTVSTIETPVISPNKDNQGQTNQYGQVVGGHRHLQGTNQQQFLSNTHKGPHDVAQQSINPYANEQYWQQQMQQEQNRLAQGQRNLNQVSIASQRSPPTQSFQPPTSVQGQPHSVHDQRFLPQSQGFSPQGQIGGTQTNAAVHSQHISPVNIQGQGQNMPTGNIQGPGQQIPPGNIQGQHISQGNIQGHDQQQVSQTQPNVASNMPNTIPNQYPSQTIVGGGLQNQQVGSQFPLSQQQNQFPQQGVQLQPSGAGTVNQYQTTTGPQQSHPAGQQSYQSSQSQGTNQNLQMVQTPISIQQQNVNKQPYSSQSYVQPQLQGSHMQNTVRQPGNMALGSMYQPTSAQGHQIQYPGPAVSQQGQSQQIVPNQTIPVSQPYQHGNQGQIEPKQQFQQNQTVIPPNQTYSPKLQSQPHQSPIHQPAASGVQFSGQQPPSFSQGHVQAGQYHQMTPQNFHQQTPQSQTPKSGVQHPQQPAVSGYSGHPQPQQHQQMSQSGFQQPHKAPVSGYSGQPQQPQMPQSGVQQPLNTPVSGYSGQPQPQQQQPQMPQSGVQQPHNTQISGYSGQPQQQQPQMSQSGVHHPPNTPVSGYSGQPQPPQMPPQQFQGQNLQAQQGQQFQGQLPYKNQFATQQLPGQNMILQGQVQSTRGLQGQQLHPKSNIQGQGQNSLGPSSTLIQTVSQTSTEGVQSGLQGQNYPTKQNISSVEFSQNQNILQQQGQGQIAGNLQGHINQGQQPQFQGGVSMSRPTIPAPPYSDTSINRQATMQRITGQHGYSGQPSNPGQGQGHILKGQINQQQTSNFATQHQQAAVTGSLNNQMRGQSPSLTQGPLPGQGQVQGQNIQSVGPSAQFPGQQPSLQPQILQPTVVHQPTTQDPLKGHVQDRDQGQTNVKTGEDTSIAPSRPIDQPTKPIGVYPGGSSDLVQDIPNTDAGHSESRAIPASRQLSTASSLDEILSSSPDTRDRVDLVLAPKVLTAQEIQQQKEEQLKNSNIVVQSKDPYKDRSKLDKFVTEVEKFAKFIEGYEKPSCSGPTPLDSVFKEVMEDQEKAGRKQTLAIARCYPMKNRDQDIMPFDDSRVLISSLKDDYINASWITDVSPSCPKFIATQWPLPVTLVDFWVTVYEQGVEVIAALSSDIETGKKFPVYVPEVKGETISHGPVQLTLQSVKQKPFWTERIIHLRHSETKSGRTVVYLHYSTWPVSGYPEKVSYLLQFITEVHSFYRQQRSLLKPIVVHCSNGVGRTGIFLLTYMGMMEINHGQGIINIPDVAGKILWKRRNLIHKKDQLKYCYDALLYYAQDVLAKQGILIHKASFGDQLPKPGVKSQSWEPGEDILFGSMSFSNLQTNIAKLGTKGETTRLDQRLQMLKTGEKDDEIVEKCNSEMKSSSGTILPDLVQSSPGRSIESKTTDEIILEPVNTNTVEKIFDDFDSKVGVSDSPKSIVDINETLEMRKSSSPYGSSISSPAHSSHESSSSPQLSKKIEGGISLNLSDLQDPNTFTIGTGESSKKKKITKADFTGEKKKEEIVDPDDPLSSLDPFWTVKK